MAKAEQEVEGGRYETIAEAIRHHYDELTATERTGLHRYSFPASDEAHVILDLTSGIYNYDGKVVWTSVRVENDTLVTGSRQTHGWARTRYLYFAMTFSKPMRSYGLRNDEPLVYRGFWRKWSEDEGFPERAGRRVKCHFDFETADASDVSILNHRYCRPLRHARAVGALWAG